MDRPAIIYLMGHGKVAQVLGDEESDQHACADYFMKAGNLVYGMETRLGNQVRTLIMSRT